jgi:hypothetical protein
VWGSTRTPLLRASLLAVLVAIAGPADAHDVEPPAADCQAGEAVPRLQYGGGTENCSLDAAGEIDVFEFIGAFGDVFRLILVTDAFLDAHLAVRDSQGALLAEQVCDGGAAPGPSPSCVIELDLDPLSQPQIDLYDVEVGDVGGDETGAYQLQLEIIPTLQPTEVIDLDRVSFTDFKVLETPTDMDQAAFDALALEPVSVEIVAFEDDVDLDPRVEIFAPDGSLLESNSCEGGGLPGTACTTTVSTVVPAAGRYVFAVSDEGHDDFGNQGGRYEYTFRRLPEPSSRVLAAAALAAFGLLARRRPA